MALALLDGTTAAVNISIANANFTCLFQYVSADIGRQFTDFTTFCSSGWKSEVPGMKQLTGRFDGFLSTGNAVSDPSQFFSSQSTENIVITFTTNCTYTFAGYIGNSHAGIRAAAGSEESLQFRSYGAPTFAWQVT